MRLDHFLPPRTRPPVGLLRRALRAVGTTWLAAPARRIVQAGAFLLFLVLLFWVAWPYGGHNYAETRAARELVDAELFLALDPLVSISAAVAAKTWVWSLGFAGLIFLLGVFVPRGFCGYLCPLGTLVDLFDRTLGRRVARFRVDADGWWIHLKHYLLVATLVAALFGLTLSGFVAAIPVLVRGVLFATEPVVTGTLRGWHLVPPLNAGHAVSLVLFVLVLALGLLRPRFWCRYVCPTGALLSWANLIRVTERKVESSCIACSSCVAVCPFDAIQDDFTTRTLACTLCQTCGGVCPVRAIKFVDRWDDTDLKAATGAAARTVPLSRRGFLGATLGGVAAVLGTDRLAGAALEDPARPLPVRPPGSVPERDFLRLCIRCEECLKACPNNVLQPLGFEQGLEGLWTPQVVPNWAGCEPTCNNCGQVCPTGAIRALPLAEKRAARIGLAVIDERTCLPLAGRAACQMCVDECNAAGYRAIDFVRVRVETDAAGQPVEGSGFLAPVVAAERCIGCGLCQTRCFAINVLVKRSLADTAIRVVAGPGREDRMAGGSYAALRADERRERAAREERERTEQGVTDTYLPDFLDKK